MLRRLNLSPTQVPAVRSDPNTQDLLRALTVSSGEEVRIYAHRDDKDPVTLSLDIYVRSRQPRSCQAISSLRTTSSEKPEPRLSRKCSWVALKRLYKELLLAVGGDGSNRHQCEQCRQIAAHLELCFKHAALFDRTWNGVMVLSTKKVTHFINTLLRLAHSVNDEEDDEGKSGHAEAHKQIIAVLTSFLLPTGQ